MAVLKKEPFEDLNYGVYSKGSYYLLNADQNQRNMNSYFPQFSRNNSSSHKIPSNNDFKLKTNALDRKTDKSYNFGGTVIYYF